MLIRNRLWFAAAAISLGFPWGAASAADVDRVRELPRLAGEATIDGVLDEPAWTQALRVDNFFEITPGDNTPAVVRTVGYLWYDEQALYVAFRCFDPHPEEIRAVYSDRDNVFSDQDLVQFDLDTRNDEKTSFIFRTNPHGIQADAIFSEATGIDDYSPDFSFDVEARIVDDGWVAEFRVPFSSIRYSAGLQQWGITLFRNYPRDYRRQMTSLPIPRGANCWLCYNLKLNGISNLPDSRYLLMVPYTTIQDAPNENGGAMDTTAGADIKWIPGGNITIDATINPDFAQVESDVPQITVNDRFALFLPEKRSFFLERADLPVTPLNAVYTRTINSPAWGARITGQAGNSAYMFLLAEDEGGGSRIVPGPVASVLTPQTGNATVAIGRWRTTLGDSLAGFVFTDRESDGRFNRLLGPDFQWRPNETHQLSGQLLVSDTGDDRVASQDSITDYALMLGYGYSSASTGFQLEYQRLGTDFRADSGFIPQVGIERKSATVFKDYYLNHWLNQVEAGLSADSAAEIGADQVSRSTYPYLLLYGKWNSSLLLQYHRKEQLRAATRLLEHDYLYYEIAVEPSRWFSGLEISGELGEQADIANERVGRGGALSIAASFRPTIHLTAEIQAERQWIDISRERLLTADVAQLKATYNFSAQMFLRVIGQYEHVYRNPLLYRTPVDEREGSFGGSILYGYRFNWLTAIYAGYSDERLLVDGAGYAAGTRHFFVKLAYALEH